MLGTESKNPLEEQSLLLPLNHPLLCQVLIVLNHVLVIMLYSNMSPRHLWTAPESSQTWGHWQLQEADLEAKLAALELELSRALSLGGIQPLALSCVGL